MKIIFASLIILFLIGSTLYVAKSPNELMPVLGLFVGCGLGFSISMYVFASIGQRLYNQHKEGQEKLEADILEEAMNRLDS